MAADPFAFDLKDTLRVISKSKTDLIRIHVGRADLSRSARRSAPIRLQSDLRGSQDPLRGSGPWDWTSAALRRRRVRLSETCRKYR